MHADNSIQCDECLEPLEWEVHWPAWVAMLCGYHKDLRVRSSSEGNPPNPPVSVIYVGVVNA